MPIFSGPAIRKKYWQEDFYTQNQFWLDSFDPQKGQYRFLSVEEAKQQLDPAWLQPAEQCPYLGTLEGFVNWEWWQGLVSYEDREFMTLSWLRYSNGFIARPDSKESFSFVKKLSYPLRDITSVYGFEQGEVFLKEVDSSYFSELQELVIHKLNTLGIQKETDPYYSTGRNELYLKEPIEKEKLEGEIIEFWGFDINLTKQKSWALFLMEE